MVAGGRLAMNRLLGWFPHTYREWIEFIIVAVLLWLLMGHIGVGSRVM
jgi:hypothetical protein